MLSVNGRTLVDDALSKFFCKVLQMFLFSSVFCNFTIFCILLTKLVVARHKASIVVGRHGNFTVAVMTKYDDF